ncbi:MAG: serine/threonine protein kinase [Proteobacteria bacterium]|nr:serine/threonine protein kinase [Pseudomonadota bacterium]
MTGSHRGGDGRGAGDSNLLAGTPARRASDRHDPWLGKIIDNRYHVLEVIGRGGMGVVYKVEHQRMGKIAAMKVLHNEYAEDQEVKSRFLREAEAVSRLTHPNTVQVFDRGESRRGALYLIMEYVRGQDMGTLVKRDGPIPFARAAPLFVQICGALAEAHSLGVVHRDLKPENILVTRTVRGRDFVKVLDFGLAKLSEREEQAEVTDRGSVVGTPYYMSPEQIRGDEIDHRTDIYALGALMYRVITGEHAFNAKTPVGVLTQHLTAPLILPSERVPELDIAYQVDRVIARAMKKKRDERYQAIDALQDDLEQAFIDVCEPSASRALPEISSLSPAVRRQATRLPLEESDQIDYGIDTSVRLRRSDVDAYESSRKRRWLVRVALIPLLFATMCAAVIYYAVVRAETPRRTEREPNNQLEDATLIAVDTAVTGYLGKRISKSNPDRDYYRVNEPDPVESSVQRQTGPDASGAQTGQVIRVITAHLTSPPNIDVELSVFDATGTLLWRVSEGGVGHEEWIRQLRIVGPFHLLVTEAMPIGAILPTENVSDIYSLRVTSDRVAPGLEIEPNENSSDAVSIAPNQPITGYLERRSDVDTYRFDGPAGGYEVIIDGAKDIPVRWNVAGQKPSRKRRAAIDLATGDLLHLRRGDRDLPGGQPLPGQNSAYTLRIEPATAR